MPSQLDRSKRKIARYDGKRLLIAFEDRGRPPLTAEECQRVYEGMNECASNRDFDPDCKDPARFAGAIAGEVIPILQQPGLNYREFTQACVAACKSGKAPPLDAAFRKSMCGIGK